MNIQKLIQMGNTDYDRKLLKSDEIVSFIGRPSEIQLCERHSINYRVIASELVHTKTELKALEAITPTFRNESAHDAQIAELNRQVAELETTLENVFTTATDRESFTKQEEAKSRAVAKIAPLLAELKSLAKELQGVETMILRYRDIYEVMPDGHLVNVALLAIKYAKSGRAD